MSGVVKNCYEFWCEGLETKQKRWESQVEDKMQLIESIQMKKLEEEAKRREEDYQFLTLNGLAGGAVELD
jgi:hypothetical protein